MKGALRFDLEDDRGDAMGLISSVRKTSASSDCGLDVAFFSGLGVVS